MVLTTRSPPGCYGHLLSQILAFSRILSINNYTPEKVGLTTQYLICLNISIFHTLPLFYFFLQGVWDHIYKNLVKLNQHTKDSSSFLGALGFTRQVELLALKTVPTESLLSWLTKPTSPHLVEVASEPGPLSALALIWTPEALHNLKDSKVGVGLVYKTPYIPSASFCEAYFSLKSISKAEVGKRSYGPGLMFVRITEASLRAPHPIEKPLYLDVKHPSYITSSYTLRSPVVYRGFKLHKVLLVEEDTRTFQVVLPHLEGVSTHGLITYQKHQMTPEFRRPEIIDTPLAVAHEKHWNIVNNPVFPACLEEFKTRHEASKRTTSQTAPCQMSEADENR